ncbi:unnamed protein product [Ostreobium quekettii]|uniref:PAP-associated domain-containing protein n=1 Tax=Ostreobium quekettii TaxID=121088 RepID=A0A8S1J4Q1_9CHLO|nr:unnamed protein product [Ostreobium quekettii]
MRSAWTYLSTMLLDPWPQNSSRKLKEYPTARPVCLVIKTFLKELDLNEVASRGLGGYTLANMVLAQCLEDMGNPAEEDYGEALLNFLELFGTRFDYVRQAVCLRRDGVLTKKQIEEEARKWIFNPAWEGRTDRKKRLLVEDPLTGLNISGASSRYGEIRGHFSRACGELKRETEKGENVNPLNVLLDVAEVIRRPEVPNRPHRIHTARRRRLEHTGETVMRLRAPHAMGCSAVRLC